LSGFRANELPGMNAQLAAKAAGRGKRRLRAAWPGMLLHQDGSTHARVPGVANGT